MDKECGEIKITRTETGLRIDINGKNLEDFCSCGCMKIVRGDAKAEAMAESKPGENCCPQGDKQKPGCC